MVEYKRPWAKFPSNERCRRGRDVCWMLEEAETRRAVLHIIAYVCVNFAIAGSLFKRR